MLLLTEIRAEIYKCTALCICTLCTALYTL